MNTCFENIIGLSRSDATCFTSEFNDAARVSVSGLYLDEAEGFPGLDIIKSIATGEAKTLQELLTRAREDGINQFREQLYKELGVRYAVKSQAYIDFAGQTGYTGNLTQTFAYAALVLEMKTFRGATVKITDIWPQFNYTGTIEVKVYKAYNNGNYYQVIDDTEIATISLNVTPSSSSVAVSPVLELPTTDETGRAYSYLFVYATAGVTARNNGTSCGCGKEQIMRQYFSLFGVAGTAYNNMLLANRTNYLNGLLVKVEARCSGGDFICSNYYDNEFIRVAINNAVRNKAASNALVKILTSQIINAYTMARREQIGNTINILNAKFNKSVAWIAETMDMRRNDCYQCSPGTTGSAFETTVGGIYL